MPKTKKTISSKSSESARLGPVPVIVTMGCPGGVGPEVSLGAAFKKGAPPCLLVGDRGAFEQAGRALGYSARRLAQIGEYHPGAAPGLGIQIYQVGSPLSAKDRRTGKFSPAGGAAQLEYIESGFALSRATGFPLVTGPVSKEAIARCGIVRARKFLGHTEWLEGLDGAPHSVMCFVSDRLTTSLVTTHVPVRAVPRLLTKDLVARSVLELVDLLLRTGKERPHVAVTSLNPHAGEGELIGREETVAIFPGIQKALKVARGRAEIFGPVGAETAYRKAAAGTYDGVVAMYHDQATIPMKLLDFGGAVNVTQGLSIVRTSVDHGTAYDIAGRGQADARGMFSAMRLAEALGKSPRVLKHGAW